MPRDEEKYFTKIATDQNCISFILIKQIMKNYKQDNATGANHEGIKPNMPLKYLTATSIIGDKVQFPEGESTGTIKDVMIDLSTGQIEYFIIEFGGFLGIGEKYYAIPFALLKVDAQQEIFILDQKMEILKNAPGFDKEHWPETNSHQFDHSSAYWGGFMGVNTGAMPYL
jgi:sporulation protein YlmC with PRC-barrel domain